MTRQNPISFVIAAAGLVAFPVFGLSRIDSAENQNQGKASAIPFFVSRNKMLISVSVGQTRPLKIILDSGMGWDGLLIYNPDIRDSIRLINPASANIGGAGKGGSASALFSDSMTFSVGLMTFHKQRVVVLQNDSFKGFPSDGVIGYSLFGHYTLEVNLDDSILVLHDPDKWRADSSWEEIPIAFKENQIPWIDAKIVVGDEEPIPVSCYIDFASGETIELLLKPGQKFRVPQDTKDQYLGRGLSGDIYGKKGRIAKVFLGSFELEDVPAAFAPAEVRSKQKGADGVIANTLLRKFNLVFDYTHQKLYLKPNRHFDRPF